MTLHSLPFGLGLLSLCALGGCAVYPVGGGEVLILPPGPPSLNVAFYGTPAGYNHGAYPVYLYNGRPCYYAGGRRYWYNRGASSRNVAVTVNRNVRYNSAYSSGYHQNHNRYNRSYTRKVNVNRTYYRR